MNKELVTRQPVTDSAWMQALDAYLVKHLYNGDIASKRIKLMNFILDRLHPDEIPLTYAKTLDLLANAAERPRPDVWVARLVMMPQIDADTSNLLWGEKLIHDLRGNEKVTVGVREAMGWFYRLVLIYNIQQHKANASVRSATMCVQFYKAVAP